MDYNISGNEVLSMSDFKSNISESCKECVVREFQEISNNQLIFTQKILDSQNVLIKILIIILGVIALGGEVMKSLNLL